MARSVLACAVVIAMLGGCRDDPAPPAAIAGPIAGPAAPAIAVDLSLGAGFELRRPLRDGRLAVIPIVATGDLAPASYTTLARALAEHTATVRELPGQWEVDTVRIRNRGTAAVVAYAGELVLDGKQDRVLAETRVIAPGRTADVAARCVERERQEGGSAFAVPGWLAELDLRRAVAFGSQLDVWIEVVAIDHELGLAPPTGTYRLAAARVALGDAATRRARLAAALAAHPDRARMVGLAAVVDGEVIAIDRFATPALFRDEETELLGAYVAGTGGAPHEGRTFLPSDVRTLAAAVGQNWTTPATFTALRAL